MTAATHTFREVMTGARDDRGVTLTLFEVCCIAGLQPDDHLTGQEWLAPSQALGAPFACPVCGVEVALTADTPWPTDQEPVEPDDDLMALLANGPSLAALLRQLHTAGCWVEAWYPLSNGTFECRLRDGHGTGIVAWATDADPLQALQQAMTKAGIR